MDDTPPSTPWPAGPERDLPYTPPPLPRFGPQNQADFPTQPRFAPQDISGLPTVPIQLSDGRVSATAIVPGQAVGGYAPAGHPPPPASGRPRRGVSRRGVLIGAGLGALGLGAAGAGVGIWFSRQNAAGLPSLTDAGKYLHLLRRAGFGARPGEIGDYINLGISGSIDRLLHPSAVADNLETQLNALGLDFSKPQDIQRWFLLRMIYSKRPLEEKMTLFWHGLLTSSFRKIGGKGGYPLLKQQNDLLRTMGLGRFDDLIKAISIDPAMLWWLDGRVNTAHAPNENYARELMELFVLGITNAQGAANYSQDDVEGGAHALTGWVIPRGSNQSRFVPSLHDNSSKTYLGQTGNLGLDDVVRIVCAHPSAGYHLANRMWTFFVYEGPSISDLQPLIDAYNQQDHSIAAVVRAMLTSPQFFSAQAYRARVKSPTEFVVGSIRALEQVTDGRNLVPLMATMGQDLFDPPNVSGWDGDKVSANWVSTQSWMTRLNFVNALLAVASGSTAARAKNQPGANAGAATPSAAATPALQQLIDTWKFTSPKAFTDFFVDLLLDSQLPADRRATIDAYLGAGLTAAGPLLTLTGGAKLPAVAARGALYLLMTLPEFHLN